MRVCILCLCVIISVIEGSWEEAQQYLLQAMSFCFKKAIISLPLLTKTTRPVAAFIRAGQISWLNGPQANPSERRREGRGEEKRGEKEGERRGEDKRSRTKALHQNSSLEQHITTDDLGTACVLVLIGCRQNAPLLNLIRLFLLSTSRLAPNTKNCR